MKHQQDLRLFIGPAVIVALAAGATGIAVAREHPGVMLAAHAAAAAPAAAAVAPPPPSAQESLTPQPSTQQLITMNPRSAFAEVSTATGAISETSNAGQPEEALSIIKLYLVEDVLTRGDGSADDRALAQRAIQLSDNSAADALDSKYPGAIDAAAATFHLTATSRGSFWGDSDTSAVDAAEFLNALVHDDPGSPVLAWMATASPIAADGTAQNWGTAHLPGVIGTKWGWSDDEASEVASASYGNGFTAAAFTDGDANAENADLAPLDR